MAEKIIKNLSLGVVVYVICYMLATILYCSPRIFASFSDVMDVSFVNESFTFPLEIFSWGLLIICSACSGVDLGIGKRYKVKMKKTVELSQIFLVTVLLVATFLESCALVYFFGHPVTIETNYGIQRFEGVVLPMEGICTAIISACTFLFTGSQLASAEEEEKGEEQV